VTVDQACSSYPLLGGLHGKSDVTHSRRAWQESAASVNGRRAALPSNTRLLPAGLRVCGTPVARPTHYRGWRGGTHAWPLWEPACASAFYSRTGGRFDCAASVQVLTESHSLEAKQY